MLTLKAIRIRLYIVMTLMVAAIVLTAFLYMQGKPLMFDEKQFGCGTISQSVVHSTQGLAGQKLFQLNCSSCHAIHKDLTGPALEGFDNRISMDDFYLLLQQPKKAVKKNKYLKKLMTNYSNIRHTSFQGLSKSEVDDIALYIREASGR